MALDGKQLKCRDRAPGYGKVDKVDIRVLFVESLENFSGPKSQLSNCNPLVLKS